MLREIKALSPISNLVVGSGPTGVALAYSLLKHGEKVVMIDGGKDLEKDTKLALDTLKNTLPEDLPFDALKKLRGNIKADRRGVQVKKFFGSDFPYQGSEGFIGTANNIGNLTPSLAVGGFSNVWGSAILPYRQEDINDWPIKIKDLESGFRNSLELIKVMDGNDDIRKNFPLYSEFAHNLNISNQARIILENLQKNASYFEKFGIIFGKSRLAFQKEELLQNQGSTTCIYCGNCMYGCPYDLIYSTKKTLLYLKRNFDNSFIYLPGIILDSFTKDKDYSELILSDSDTLQEVVKINVKNLILATGPLSTTKIILKSLRVYNKIFTLKTSEYFLLPFLGPRFEGNINTPTINTLAQIFIEVNGGKFSRLPIHIQIYTYNDLYKAALDQILGKYLSLTATPLLRRLHVGQGYLHSEESSTISISLDDSEKLNLFGNNSQISSKLIKTLSKFLLQSSLRTGLIPIIPMTKVGPPGEGRHVGGVFPMKSNPIEYECTPEGSLYGFDNIYLADTSVFTSIPAPTITLTAMANASRIGEIIAHKKTQSNCFNI